jgi:uroporphyrinogen decarboxylase
MTGRERILCALRGGQPDRVPLFEANINDPIILKLAALLLPGWRPTRAGSEDFAEVRCAIGNLYVSIVHALDLDATCTGPSARMKRLDERHVQDKFGTVWALSEHGEPFPREGPIRGLGDLREFAMVSNLDRGDFETVKYVIEAAGRDRAHFVTITDPFKTSWSLRGGMENLLFDYGLDPALVHQMMRMATDYAKAAIDIAVEVGADGILLSGDFAGEETLLMSPKHFREYVKPYHREIVDHTHQKGRMIVKHSDGQMWPILDDLMDVGFDGFHPVQPQCMDIAEVKRYVAGRMCLIGNIDCRVLLPFGTQEEVGKTVKETIEKAAPGGGYILSSSNTIHPGCKAENYIAMVRAARAYGRSG